jgi:endonuclease YncB( thermonuclease family)
VALCSVEGVDLSKWMVMQGQAIAFRKYSLDYVGDEDRARAAKIGLWAG